MRKSLTKLAAQALLAEESGKADAPADGGAANDLAGPKLLYTKREAARMLSIGERMIDYLREDGKLKAGKIGTRIVFSIDELRRFVRATTDGAETQE